MGMNVVLLLSAVAALVLGSLLAMRFLIGGLNEWTLSEKVGASQIFLPFAAAVFTLNALFGDTWETPSKIVAAVFALLAGVLAIVKQVAKTIEDHRAGFAGSAPVTWSDVVSRIVSG
jgi:hypothetical protein